MTPEERAQKYMDEQMIVYNRFVKEFAPDLESLKSEPVFGKMRDISGIQQERKKEHARDERKELHSWEDIFANAPLSEQGI
jgi:hypothetical protein